jgi:predicted dehydrogenase
MLDEVEPDLLCIATRQTLHADQIEAAVAAGVRGILCDKPLATSLTEMDRIVAACAAVPLAFALDRRWYAAYCQLRQQLAAGRVGEIASLTAYGLPNAINHGCHWYDAVLGLMGDPEPQWVSGLLNDVSAEPSDSRVRMDPSARLQIGMDNGAVAFVTAGGPKGIGFDIAGSAGRVAIYADATVAWHWNEGSDAAESIPLSSAAEPWPSGPAMVADLVNAVRTGGRTACDIEQARRATEIGFALHNSSAAEGARVSLPAADRALRIESFPWGNEPA